MTVEYGVQAIPMIQYDGTNSEDVVAAIGDYCNRGNDQDPPYIVVTDSSEADGVLTVDYDENAFPTMPRSINIQSGEWVTMGVGPFVLTDADRTEKWIIREA